MGKRGELKNKIMDVLTSTGIPWSPKNLAFEIGASYPAVKMALKRMVEEGDVVKLNGRGLYISRHTVLVPANHGKFWTEKPLTLHGIKIVTKQRGGLSSVTLDALRTHHNYTLHRHRVNHSVTFDEEWRERKITVTYFERTKEGYGYIEVFLRASIKPVTFSEFDAFVGWLEGAFPGININSWVVEQLGINWDTQELRLEGVSALTLRAFKNVWLRMYQKSQDLLRVEAHVNVSLTLPEVLEVLSRALDSIDETLKERVLVVTEDMRK